MSVSEDIAPWLVREITKGSGRFADPFAEPNGYSIVEAEDEVALLAARGRYLDRLRYAVANADALIAGAFRRSFTTSTAWTGTRSIRRRRCAGAWCSIPLFWMPGTAALVPA